MKPFSYQRTCLGRLAKARARGDKKALVVMATGLGKTVVSAFEIQRLLKVAPGRVLYLCHQNEILRQARATYEEVLGDSYSYGYFHGTEKHLHHVDVLFASFQTMATWREAFFRGEFRYVVVDEVHHAHATTFRPTVEYFTPEFMLALTATPERGDGLDITELFGKPVFNLGLFKALAKRYLCDVDYRVMTDEIQNAGVLDTPIGKLSIAELNRNLFIPKRDEEIARIIGEKMSEVQNPRAMIFCASIEHAERMAALMPHAAVVHSKLRHKEKNKRLDAFRSGEVDTILTVDMLNEGIDVPEANVIVFLRSTSSRTIFLQQLGRGLRKALGKLKVLVLDFVANCERIEMIDALSKGVKAAGGTISGGLTVGGDGAKLPDDPFILTLDGIEFDERLWKLVDVIHDAREGYTEAVLKSQLENKAAALGRTPSGREVADDPAMASVSTFLTAFQVKTWNAVLEKLGYEKVREYYRAYPVTVLKEQMQAKATALKRAPTSTDVDDDPNMASSATFYRAFGSRWNDDVLSACGIQGTTRVYTDEQLIKQLQDAAEELGRTPTGVQITEMDGYANADTFTSRFGSYPAAVRLAGLELHGYGESRAQIVQQLKALSKALGRTPKKEDIAQASKRREVVSMQQIRDKFGDLASALEAAGMTPTQKRGWTDDQLLDQLILLWDRLGRKPSTKDVMAAASRQECVSVKTFVHRFKGLGVALQHAEQRKER